MAVAGCVETADPEVDGTDSTVATLAPTGGTEAVETTTTTPEIPDIVAEPGMLVWVHDQLPPDLHADDPDNPADIAAWVQQGLIEGLFGVDASNAYYPELLDGEPELEQLNSGTVVITYRLRSGLTWSDGMPLTADDVAFTHEMIVEGCEVESDRSIVDAGSGGCEYDLSSRFGYELITDFEVENDTTFVVTMASFYAGWRDLYDRVFARHAYGPTARDLDENLRAWTAPTGILPSSGPLQFDRWEPGGDLVLRRNDRYHGSVSPDAVSPGPVSIEGVQIVFVPDQQSRIELALRGDAHLMMTALDPELAVLNDSAEFVVAPSAGPVFEHWGFNLLNEHLAKPEVREAIVYAIDKTALVAELYQPILGEIVAPDGLGNAFWMANQAPYEDHQRTYAGANDAAVARVLTSAGYSPGSDGIWTHPADGRLSLRAGTTAGVRLRDRQLEILVEQLATSGIEIIIDSAPGGLFFTEGPFNPEALSAAASGGAAGNGRLWDIAQFSWTSAPWPGSISGSYRSGSVSNPYGFSNPAYDVAATDCNSVLDQTERAACYNDLDRFVTTLDQGNDGLFVVPLTQKPRFFGYSTVLEAGAVAPDLLRGGPLVNAVDYRFAG